MKQTELVECPKCGRKNRIGDPSRGTYRCGSCKETLWVPGRAPVDPSPSGNSDMIPDCEWVDVEEDAVNVDAATSIRRKLVSLLSGIMPRVSPRFVLFVLSLASFSVFTVSGRFLWGGTFYLVTGAFWFAHLATLRASHRPTLITELPLFALVLYYCFTLPSHVVYFAKEKLRRLVSPERFRVSVGSSSDEIKKFRRWKEAVEYARKKAAQRASKPPYKIQGGTNGISPCTMFGPSPPKGQKTRKHTPLGL